MFHGYCLVFHIALPHVKDDASLNMHCLDTSLEVLETVREGKGLPPYARRSFVGSGTVFRRTGDRPALLTLNVSTTSGSSDPRPTCAAAKLVLHVGSGIGTDVGSGIGTIVGSGIAN